MNIKFSKPKAHIINEIVDDAVVKFTRTVVEEQATINSFEGHECQAELIKQRWYNMRFFLDACSLAERNPRHMLDDYIEVVKAGELTFAAGQVIDELDQFIEKHNKGYD